MPEPGRRSLEKGLISVVVGLVTAAVTVIALEPLLRQLYPVPSVDPLSTPERYWEMLGSLPGITSLLVLMLFAVASLIGGVATSLTSGRTRSWPSLVTGGVLLIAGTLGVMTVRQPLWFTLASFLTYPPAYAGHLLVRKSP